MAEESPSNHLSHGNTTFSVQADPRSTVEISIQATIMCLILLSGSIGNILILLAIYIDKTLQTVTNAFVVNLACADLLLSLTGMPFTLVSSITYEWIFGPVWCDINGMANSLFCVASILTLAAVSIDRYIAIIHPFRYISHMTKKTAAIIITYIWIHSLIIALLPVMGWSRYSFLRKESICTVYWELDISCTIFIFAVCFLFPFAIMIFTYSRIFKTAWQQSNKLVPVTGIFSLHKKETERLDSSTCDPISVGSMPSANRPSRTRSTYVHTSLSTEENVKFFPGKLPPKDSLSTIQKNYKVHAKKENISVPSCYVNSDALGLDLCEDRKTKDKSDFDNNVLKFVINPRYLEISPVGQDNGFAELETETPANSSGNTFYANRNARTPINPDAKSITNKSTITDTRRKNGFILHGDKNTKTTELEAKVGPMSSECNEENYAKNKYEFRNYSLNGAIMGANRNYSQNGDMNQQRALKNAAVICQDNGKQPAATLNSDPQQCHDSKSQSSDLSYEVFLSEENKILQIEEPTSVNSDTREYHNVQFTASPESKISVVAGTSETPTGSPKPEKRLRRVTVGCYPSTFVKEGQEERLGIQNGDLFQRPISGKEHKVTNQSTSISNSTPYLQKSPSKTSLRVKNEENFVQRKISGFRIPSPSVRRLRKKSTNQGVLKMRQERKAVRTLLIVVGTFVICWLPHFIGIFCILTKDCPWPDRYFAITTWLAMANSGCNPVIYGAMSRQFRKRFRQILQCRRGFF